MKTLEELRNTPKLIISKEYPGSSGGVFGEIQFDDLKFKGTVLAGFNEEGWEHVSISHYKKKQLPTWEVMCRVKDMFWRKDEEVVQIHPKESEYLHGVNGLENVLHLWRPVDGDWSLMGRS